MKASQRFTVHQYHHSVREHDAVTNHMRMIRDALEDVGVDGEIFAHEPHLREAQKFSPSRVWNCDLFLVHHSQGNPQLRDVIRIEVPKALVYHNITPPEFYKHDTYISNLCELGRRQLVLIGKSLKESFAVSRFNAWDLQTLGFSDTKQLPLLDLSSKAPTKARAPGKKRRLLFVGKLTPHKNQALLIKVLYYLKTAELTLIGGQDPVYGDYLRGLAKSLGVESRVRMLGKVSDEQLKKHYREHDAFVCVSQHEGFCIPLVEAMQHGLPVFAIPRSGIGETLGDAGIRLKTRKPHWIAEVIDAALADKSVLAHVAKAQAKRVGELSEFHNKKVLREILLDTLNHLRAPRTYQRKESSGTLQAHYAPRTSL